MQVKKSVQNSIDLKKLQKNKLVSIKFTQNVHYDQDKVLHAAGGIS
jgi:hypothetical protein